jgi:hypothetical protein
VSHPRQADEAPQSNAGAFFLLPSAEAFRSHFFSIKTKYRHLKFMNTELPSARELASEPDSRPYVFRFDIRAPPGPVVCNQARPARSLLKLLKPRFHGKLAWGEPISRSHP